MGLDKILRHTLFSDIHLTEVVLRDGLTLLRQRSPLAQSCGVVSTVMASMPALKSAHTGMARQTIDSTMAAGNRNAFDIRGRIEEGMGALQGGVL
jgi:hypothetical protein